MSEKTSENEFEEFDDGDFDEEFSSFEEDFDEEGVVLDEEDGLENWDVSEEEQSFDKKKKSSFSNIIIIGGGVLVGLGVLVMLFGGSSTPPPTPVQKEVASKQVALVPQKTDSEEEQNAKAKAKSMLTDQDFFFGSEKNDLEEEAETLPDKNLALEADPSMRSLEKSIDGQEEVFETKMEIVNTEDALKEDVELEGQTPPNSLTPLPNEIEDVPLDLGSLPPQAQTVVEADQVQGKSGIPKLKDVIKEDTQKEVFSKNNVLPISKKITQEQVFGGSANPSTDLENHEIEGLKDKISALEEKILILQEAQPSEEGGQGAIYVDDTLKSISESIKKLEQRMDKIASSQEEIQSEVNGLSDRVSALSSVQKSGQNYSAVASPKEDKVAPSIKRYSPKMEDSGESSSIVSRNQKTPWVLKSAVPGKAMVSPIGKSETYSISVGDNFPGLGEIKSIQMINGRWVVQGTDGTIHQ